MNPKDNPKRPMIDYPCLWQYKILGRDKNEILAAIDKVFDGKASMVGAPRESSGKKYTSLSCSVKVDSENARLAYFDALSRQPGVVMVL